MGRELSSSRWSAREVFLGSVLFLSVVVQVLDWCSRGSVYAQDQSSAKPQVGFRPGPAEGGFPNVWGDGKGTVFLTDRWGVHRSTRNGDPGSWEVVLDSP